MIYGPWTMWRAETRPVVVGRPRRDRAKIKAGRKAARRRKG